MSSLESLIESNAKAIEALTSNIAEMKRDRDYMYELMSDLTNKIANLTTIPAQGYEMMKIWMIAKANWLISNNS